MNNHCLLCSIPEREQVLWENDLMYLVKTKELKGHRYRFMVCLKDHRQTPTFEERTLAYGILISVMGKLLVADRLSKISPIRGMSFTDTEVHLNSWFIVGMSDATSHPNHWHLLCCDDQGTPDELALLAKTPKVQFPIDFEFQP